MNLGGLMAGKLSFIVGLGAGYVLGARSGRERYDQIAAKAEELWRNPRVQEKADQPQQVVQEKAGQAGQAVKNKVSSTGSATGTDAHKTPGSTAGTSGRTVS
jgi:SLT domain-containing protein